jgi:hypothetical protein
MKNKEQYSSPWVRMWTGNYRRKRGLGEPPILPMSYQENKTNAQEDFYSEEDLFSGLLARISDTILGLGLIIIGGITLLIPQRNKVYERCGDIFTISRENDVMAGVFCIILGLICLWITIFKYIKINKNRSG